MTRHRATPRIFAFAACVWWTAIIFIDLIQNSPSPFGDIRWIDWRQMTLVYRIAPWMVLPFVALAAWAIASRLRGGALPPSWATWGSGAAALLWTGFVFWRAHEQAFTCAVWAPREELFGGTHCWLPHILGAAAPWLAIPLLAWLVLAALRLPSSKPVSESLRF